MVKLKNNSVGPKVIHYVSLQGGRKNITIDSNQTVEIADCERIINNEEVENKWISIIDDSSSSEQKMKQASKDVESYMSKENKSSKKK